MPQYLTQFWLQHFHELKEVEKQVQSDMEPIKKGFKEELMHVDGNKFIAGDFTAKLTIQERKNMNQDKLLAALKELGHTEAIITVEQVDQDVVEDLMYKGKLDPTAIAHCLEVKQIPVVSVTKKKARKAKVEKAMKAEVVDEEAQVIEQLKRGRNKNENDVL